MKAITFQKLTRALPLPGRIIRRLIKVVDSHITYPDVPIISNARWGIGQFEILNCREHIQQSIFFLGYYEIRESRLARRLLRAGDIFIDIGANLGWFSILAAKQVGKHGKVIAFEPSANIYNQLHRSIEINHLSNIRLEQIALSDEVGSTTLFGATHENAGLASIIISKDSLQSSAGEQVLVTKFDNYWKKEINSKVRLIKIDVEGAESKVLEGMEQVLQGRMCDYLMVEINDSRLRSIGISAMHTLDFLRSHGYKLFHIGLFGLKLIPKNETVQFGNILAELKQP